MPSAVGRYRIDRVLGSGAFASIWLAHDEILDAQVAVKVLAGGLIDDLDVRGRFIEEARILRRADSERLVRVHDIGELPDGRPYFVMSYADRGTLAERMKGRSLPLDETLRIAVEVARGVAVVNRLGVIHRDLKPSNILFQSTPDGDERLLIADLGLAKALAHASGAFTLPVGTPGYMSPEQAKFGGGLDVRADVYGLGALTYHLLTGRAPSSAPVTVPPSALRTGLTAAVDRVVMRALEADRERRWPSAEAFAEALAAPDSAAAGPTVVNPLETRQDIPRPDRTQVMPIVERPPAQGSPAESSGARSSGGGKRSRRPLIVVVVVIVLAALLGGGAYYLLTRHSHHKAAPDDYATVTDVSGKISVRVPKNWVRQPQSTWPLNIPITGRSSSPALRATPDYGSFVNDLVPVPGVFIGLTHDMAISLPPAGLRDHGPSCVAGPATGYRHGTLTGQITPWKCGNGVTIDEAGLRSTDGRFALWVRIKVTGGANLTSRILDSIAISDA